MSRFPLSCCSYFCIAIVEETFPSFPAVLITVFSVRAEVSALFSCGCFLSLDEVKLPSLWSSTCWDGDWLLSSQQYCYFSIWNCCSDCCKIFRSIFKYFRLPEVPKTSWKERPMMERVIICKKYIIQ